MLGFYNGKLVAMVFYISEKHLFSVSRSGARSGYGAAVQANIASMTIAPATFHPRRQQKAYELIAKVHHEPSVQVNCGGGGGSVGVDQEETEDDGTDDVIPEPSGKRSKRRSQDKGSKGKEK